MRPLRWISLWILLVAPAAAAASSELQDIRLWAGPESTRIVLDLSAPSRYTLFTLSDPERVVIDLERTHADLTKLGTTVVGGAVTAVRIGDRGGGTLRIVLDLGAKVTPKHFETPPNETYGHRLVVDLGLANLPPKPARVVTAPSGARDLVIAIDAGHGGEDPGAIGKAGTREKDITLAVARRLADRINAEPGMRAVLTRNGDYFVKFRDRTRRARENQADMFISIHADAFTNRAVRGSSVYVLSKGRASNEAARILADRENAADLIGGVSLDDKDNVLASVLLDLSQNAAISASRDAAAYVLTELDQVGQLKKSEVQHASLVVLTSPDVPSMLVETAYISNPDEERRLRDPGHQQRLAEAIHKGVRRYFYDNPPAGTRVAMLAARERGQPLRHVVAQGETIGDVAGRYAVSADALRRQNGINGERLATGTVLVIPTGT